MTGRIRTALLAAIGAALVWCIPAAGASAGTCTGVPHDVGHAETSANVVDVTCDAAITNGSFAVSVNRGADSPSATVSNGTGSFTCTQTFGPPGSNGGFNCTGSMSADATATVKTEFGPNPCGPPAFAGQLTVDFGDGSSFGPTPLAAYDCSGNSGTNTGNCDNVRSGHACDPGGVFQGDTKKPPKRASVKEAGKGLKFKLDLGVKGKVVTTIEVKGDVAGKTSAKAHNGDTNLVAKLSSKAAHDLAGHTTKALIHVEVIPAASEGLNTDGREYFRLKLTG